MDAMSRARAKKIKIIFFDVDGVMTDGNIFLIPQPGSGSQAAVGSVEAKGFNAHDGVGISLARVGGLKVGIITRRNSETVAIRGRDLKLDYVEQGSMDKLTTMLQILKHEGLTEKEACFVGDDIVDLPVMRRCGLAIAVPNARKEVKDEADYITKCAGGAGAARDAVEFILRAQGRLKQVMEKYLAGHSSVAPGN
jgi:3-deoxy-D-manno-octulosonate 8-phosphate phosphatase (KDO 8-P phosphatase)